VAPSAGDLLVLAQAGRSLKNSVLRNALTQLLPAEFRSVVFRGTQSPQARPELVSEEVESIKRKVGEDVSSTEEHAAFSDVIILSISDDPATKKLLESAGFVPLRCQSIGELDTMLANNEEICAFLVDSSFLSPSIGISKKLSSRSWQGFPHSLGSASTRTHSLKRTRRSATK
jgi:hypothetical protein